MASRAQLVRHCSPLRCCNNKRCPANCSPKACSPIFFRRAACAPRPQWQRSLH